MPIYTYDTAKSLSVALGLSLIENIEFSDQAFHQLLSESKNTNIPGSYSRTCAHMSVEEKRLMTVAANKAKRGMKESDRSRGLKSVAQKKRFSEMSIEEKSAHGKKSLAGISEEGKKRQTEGWNKAFSPVRQKGFKQPFTMSPHCDKMGGLFSMKRWHFDNCKFKGDQN